MERSRISLTVLFVAGFGLFGPFRTPLVYADFSFGEPTRVGSGLTGDDSVDCLSYDGLEMYIASTRAGGPGSIDMWVLKRASRDQDWGPPENLGSAVNSPGEDDIASISSDGLTLYFNSDRSGGVGRFDIYMTTRSSKNAPWGQAVNLGPTINSSSTDGGPWISPNGLELYFESFRGGGYGLADIYAAKRLKTSDPWDAPVNLGPVVNTAYGENFLSLSPDGLLLLFCEHFFGAPRPGGHGKADIWMARRASLSDPWQTPVNLGPIVNGPAHDCIPRVSPDGHALYFWSNRSGGFEAWQAAIIPDCDLNNDDEIDEQDILVLRSHWGQADPRCDIGPMPWGDGIVDDQDLRILLAQVVEPPPNALDVPRDVILDWPCPETVQSYDVYLGTSFEDVSNATRENPLRVLVSEAQTETAYDPDGLLEFARTYYWRIDEVGAAPDSVVYKGPVLKFTTEAIAYPITTNIIAKASSSQPGMGPENTVNGSGLDKNDGHSTDGSAMWLSTTAKAHWIQFGFDQVYALHELWVWNSNQLVEPILGFGAKTVKIEYSVDDATWATLEGVPEFARAPGEPAYKPNTTASFGGVLAKYVKLSIDANWGPVAQTGLAEVRFFSVPVYASRPTPPAGQEGVGIDTSLRWKAGRGAASHRVYIGTDKQAVTSGTALAGSVADTEFDPGPLNLGRTYYWRIDEVNEAKAPSVWEGPVWSFSTREYVLVDDFESYKDEEDKGACIYQTWIDGYSNETGSRVGYTQAPFAERIVVHGGKQSMPLQYRNAESPFYSVAERTFSPVRDWTVNGADTLALWLRGNPIDFLKRADGSIQMSGGGADIWDTSDQFRFAYKRLSGDGSIVAKIHSLTPTDPWAKAGVMIREGLHPASTYVFMTATSEGRRAFQHRILAGSNARSAHSNAGAVALALWIKVERKSGNFTGYYSQDGQNWTICQPDSTDLASDSTNPVRISMANDVHIGLAVTSHNMGALAIAEFSDVSFTGSVTGDWQVASIGVEQPSNAAAPLYVVVEDDRGHTQSVVHPDPAAVQTLQWRQWLIPFRDFTSAGVSLSRVKRMSIGVGDPGNPTPGGAGVIYIDDIGVGHPLSTE